MGLQPQFVRVIEQMRRFTDYLVESQSTDTEEYREAMFRKSLYKQATNQELNHVDYFRLKFRDSKFFGKQKRYARPWIKARGHERLSDLLQSISLSNQHNLTEQGRLLFFRGINFPDNSTARLGATAVIELYGALLKIPVLSLADIFDLIIVFECYWTKPAFSFLIFCAFFLDCAGERTFILWLTTSDPLGFKSRLQCKDRPMLSTILYSHPNSPNDPRVGDTVLAKRPRSALHGSYGFRQNSCFSRSCGLCDKILYLREKEKEKEARIHIVDCERRVSSNKKLHPLRVCVMSPTAELTTQSWEVAIVLVLVAVAVVGEGVCNRVCRDLGIKSTFLDRAHAAGSDFGSVDILLAQPLRLVTLTERSRISLKSLRFLVVDEVDRMLDLQFSDQLDDIISQVSDLQAVRVQRALFSATLPSHVENLAKNVVPDAWTVKIGTANTAVDTVTQTLLDVTNEFGKRFEMEQMFSRRVKLPMLVFVASKERSLALKEELRKIWGKRKVDGIFGNQSYAARTKVIHRFRTGVTPILVTTDLMSRGMDFLGVNTVVQYDFPQTRLDYIHRVGRTGRAGRRGYCVTFFTNEDRGALREIASTMRLSGCDVPDWMLEKRAGGSSRIRGKDGQLYRRPPIAESISLDPKMRQIAFFKNKEQEARRKRNRAIRFARRKKMQRRLGKSTHKPVDVKKPASKKVALRDDDSEIDSAIVDLESSESNQ
eukprot:jgi/Bigna1/130800/aug1.12_g5508